MGGGNIGSVATEAALAIVSGRYQRLIVWVVTSSAPELPTAVTGTHTERELLGVTDHLNARLDGRGSDINGKHLFGSLAGLKIGERLAWVRDAYVAREMALLAYAVPRSRAQFRGIDDGSRHRPFQMSFRRTVTPVALNRHAGKGRRLVAVQRVRYRKRFIRVTVQAFERHRPREIRIARLVVTGCHVPEPAGRVVRHRRLEQVIANPGQETDRMIARSYGILDAKFFSLARPCERLPNRVIYGPAFESRIGNGVLEFAIRCGVGPWPAKRMRHGGFRKPVDFSRMTSGTRLTRNYHHRGDNHQRQDKSQIESVAERFGVIAQLSSESCSLR